ncbi:hypothetical protein ACH5A3_21210 [Streptomyces echinatus]|uniref:hypothetical protein n=1 Tax=Streptomyces echinatus TaxID=67293 RepID=UPI0037A407E3
MTDVNSGPGWYEVISPRATTCIVYVHEDGSLYLPEGEASLSPTEFAFAAARGNAHRLVRADEAQQDPCGRPASMAAIPCSAGDHCCKGPNEARQDPAQDGEAPRPATVVWSFEGEYEADKWHGIGNTHRDHDKALNYLKHRAETDKEHRRIRMVRATTTHTVEAERVPAAVEAVAETSQEAQPCGHRPDYCWGCPGGCEHCRCHTDNTATVRSGQPETDEEIVAYSNSQRPGVLLCRAHGEGWMGLTPLTSEDLPDGGICTWNVGDECGVDVLAQPRPSR